MSRLVLALLVIFAIQATFGCGDFVLKYDMDKDHWTGPRGLPSQMQPYNAAKSSWGYTAPEHLTAGKYADGVQYVQMKMHTYQTNPGLATGSAQAAMAVAFTLLLVARLHSRKVVFSGPKSGLVLRL